MTTSAQRMTGRITVALPPDEAFRLFTPRGEQQWAHGWHPRFPAPVLDDDEPGTVFETDAHGQHTTWLVTGREPGSHISYARVTPGEQAGTVTVTIDRKSTRLNSSHVKISYAVFCLKKKKKKKKMYIKKKKKKKKKQQKNKNKKK